MLARYGIPVEPPKPLPPDVHIVDISSSIPIPEYIEVGESEIVERIRWKTPEVLIPEAITSTIFVPEYRDRPIAGRISVDSTKFEGLDENGDLKFGWYGVMTCEVQPEGMDWITLIESPLDLGSSRSMATEGPERPARRRWREVALGMGTASSVFLRYAQGRKHWGWWAQGSLRMDPASFTGFGQSEDFIDFSEDTTELSLGVSFRW